ncbi:MAG: hypothetical protein IPK58_23455 [Acidobacteria bacterium]|nr:hypothetical protein [Acidobacteriota bacterium]
MRFQDRLMSAERVVANAFGAPSRTIHPGNEALASHLTPRARILFDWPDGRRYDTR